MPIAPLRQVRHCRRRGDEEIRQRRTAHTAALSEPAERLGRGRRAMPWQCAALGLENVERGIERHDFGFGHQLLGPDRVTDVQRCALAASLQRIDGPIVPGARRIDAIDPGVAFDQEARAAICAAPNPAWASLPHQRGQIFMSTGIVIPRRAWPHAPWCARPHGAAPAGLSSRARDRACQRRAVFNGPWTRSSAPPRANSSCTPSAESATPHPQPPPRRSAPAASPRHGPRCIRRRRCCA